MKGVAVAMLTTERVQHKEQLEKAYRIRTEVFVEEQGVPVEAEIDEHENASSHVLISYDGEPAGTGRVRVVDGVAKLERICVREKFRKHQIGKAVMEALEAIAREQGLSKAKLHAQTQAAGFYERVGYKTDSEVFMEENIPHVRMIKSLI
ncbi:GNAT family N-acetyltransferase [Paenibacillus sp. LHD-117]|uniref:GNAT family N-acetyltransferase n=1 Tax=Paenibacillus sp. LHD-117 TaxID=3071412 RepID=UPI0027E159CE|nr:GNAT family N-acetyltransferase [Paenibacillus sp. LHD-117]MDQ6418032.1 GNAT family N-acetyltransferase [Paenibacillus sp. LHD-117]